jgi:ABC-2 type transport system permease protein
MTVQPTVPVLAAPAERISTARLLARTGTAEWVRLWTVRTPWWFLAAAAVFMVGLGALLGLEAAADPVSLQGEPAWQTAQSLAVPAQFALIALALTAVTSDYATGGIVPTLQWTPRRPVLYAARVLTAVGAAAGLGILLALASAAAAFATAGSALVLPLDGGLEMAATTAFVFATGAGLAVGLGFLLRNTAAALVSVFLLLLLLPVVLPLLGYDWLATAADLLPGTGMLQLLLGGVGYQGVTEASAVMTLLAWSAGALLLGWLRFRSGR